MKHIQHWQAALAQHWGIAATLTQLDGEYDLNFLGQCDDGTGIILKVMRADCEASLVDMQVRAFEHILARAPDLPCPDAVRAKDGAPFLTLNDETGVPRLVWVLR